MIIYQPCCTCGDQKEIYGWDSVGRYCRDCSPYIHCADCERLTLRADLTDCGDHHLSCSDCQMAIATMQARARMATEVGW